MRFVVLTSFSMIALASSGAIAEPADSLAAKVQPYMQPLTDCAKNNAGFYAKLLRNEDPQNIVVAVKERCVSETKVLQTAMRRTYPAGDIKYLNGLLDQGLRSIIIAEVLNARAGR